MEQLNQNPIIRTSPKTNIKSLFKKLFNKIDYTTNNLAYVRDIKMSDLMNTSISPISSPMKSNQDQNSIIIGSEETPNSQKAKMKLNLSTSTIDKNEAILVKTKIIDCTPKLQHGQIVNLSKDIKSDEPAIPPALMTNDIGVEANETISNIRKDPPIMGKHALLSKRFRRNSENNQKIVHGLVHDRFVVNLYKFKSPDEVVDVLCTEKNVEIEKISLEKSSDDSKNSSRYEEDVVAALANLDSNIAQHDNPDVSGTTSDGKISSGKDEPLTFTGEKWEYSSIFEKGKREALNNLDDCIAQNDDSFLAENSSANTSDASQLISPYNRGQSKNISCNNSPPLDEYKICFGVADKVTKLLVEQSQLTANNEQASKALKVCKEMRKFSGSEQEVECEKISLLTAIKCKAVKEAIRKLECEEQIEESISAVINISKLEFEIIRSSENKRRSNERKMHTTLYVCVLSCGENVFSTKVTTCDNDGKIQFDEVVEFSDLHIDFELTISIYSLQVKNYRCNYTHDAVLHTSSLCAPSISSVKRFRSLRVKWPKLKLNCTEFTNSSFALLAFLTLQLNAVKKVHKSCSWELDVSAENTEICSVRLNLQMKRSIVVPKKYSGFLTIGKKVKNGNYYTWSRNWCVIDNYKLNFWNYPELVEAVAPIETIELNRCAISRIEKVDVCMCSRANTLLLETYGNPTRNDRFSAVISNDSIIEQYFLSADCKSEMIEWRDELNCVVSALRNWNCMDVMNRITDL